MEFCIVLNQFHMNLPCPMNSIWYCVTGGHCYLLFWLPFFRNLDVANLIWQNGKKYRKENKQKLCPHAIMFPEQCKISDEKDDSIWFIQRAVTKVINLC